MEQEFLDKLIKRCTEIQTNLSALNREYKAINDLINCYKSKTIFPRPGKIKDFILNSLKESPGLNTNDIRDLLSSAGFSSSYHTVHSNVQRFKKEGILESRNMRYYLLEKESSRETRF